MAVQETVNIAQHRQQVRNFALIWIGITLLFGAMTFIAIYVATGLITTPKAAPISITNTTNNSDAGSNSDGAGDTSNPSGLANPSGQQPDNQPLAIAVNPSPTVGIPPTNTKPASGADTAGSADQAATQAATEAATEAANTTGPATAAPVPASTIPAVKDTNFDLGIAIQDNPDPKVFQVWTDQASKQLNLNWVKLQVVWRTLEPAQGKIDFGTLDVELPMLSKSNTKVLLSIVKAPDWARDKGAKIVPDQYDGPPADPQTFVDFVTAILKRYPGMIHAVEVWNEINLDREWSTAPQSLNPTRYVKLLQMTHDAIKALDPNIVVISAALSPTGASSDDKYQDDFTYFDRLVQAGMLKYADCVGAHHNGYNVPPTADYNNIPANPKARFRGPWDNPNHSWAFKTTLEGYHKKIVAAGSNLKICVTEFGWPSLQDLKGSPRPGFEFAGDNTLANQADYIDGAIQEMQDWGWVRLAFLFNLNYGAQAGWNMQGPSSDNVVYSILGPNFQARPVWTKIQTRDFRDKPRQAATQ